MSKVVTNILQGSAVTKTVQDGLVTHPLVANFSYHMSARNNKYQLTHVKGIRKEK